MVFTSGCNVSANIADGGLLTGKPCAPPCFFGIYPGKTQKDQAIDIMNYHGFKTRSYAGNHVGFMNNKIVFNFNQLSAYTEGVWFAPATTISVQDIIEKYGPPESVSVVLNGISSPENLEIDMGLDYDHLQMYLGLETQNNNAYELKRDMRISYGRYFDNSAYIEFITMGGQLTKTHISAWKGYGLYKDPNP